MAEWLIERGIGEERAICFANGRAVAARIYWPGRLAPGLVEDARLVSKAKAASRGVARFASGEEALVDRLPPDAREGAAMRLIVTRSAVAEPYHAKPAQARPTDAACRPAPSLEQRLAETGADTRTVERFPGMDWDDIWADAWAGKRDFAGGSLHFYAAPAMVLIDVDGTLPLRDLALAAVSPIAEALDLLAIGGAVGIDFPSLTERDDRKRVDEALAEALAHRKLERTAMNGFGFVQIVSRVELPSLLHCIAQDRAGAAARMLLRRAQATSGHGRLLQLYAHPAVLGALSDDWLAQLTRRTAKDISLKPDSALALDGGFAQAISP